MDDDEDAAGHTLEDSIHATRNRMNATLGTLTFDNQTTGKHYELQPGKIPSNASPPTEIGRASCRERV